MRHQVTSLIIKDIPVTFMLTVLRCASHALKVKGAAVVFHTIV